ncbi:mycothiol transferase [Blastococcus atacamensis]|uniref:mycothiol transferase n=1 Tax=Blastococcus atacamensis TaxID=2070508 RepID=UPI000CEBF517|nr:DUF664 domain-containing protein [Blastococcus atacamensis]
MEGQRYGGRVAAALEPESVLLPGRHVPLGWYTTVRRLLPQRQRRMAGRWCFVDHFGPEDVSGRPGMQVPPHPHTGLQTVTCVVDDDIVHRDSFLTEDEARLRLVPSRTTLLGLLEHITCVEGVLCDQALTGRSSRQIGFPSTPDRSFQLRREDTIVAVQRAYRKRRARCGRPPRLGTSRTSSPAGSERPVRALYLQMLHAIAQHCGQAGILREQVRVRRAA